MPMKQLNLRVNEADLEDWKQKAGKAGMDLSTWIREQCSNSGPEKASNENRSSQNGARDSGVSVVERGVAVPRGDRRTRTRTPGKFKHVEDVTHATLRKTCKHGTEKGWNCGLCGGMAVIE